MRNVRGFVFVDTDEGRHAFFGKPAAAGGSRFESLETNGIVPYESMAELIQAVRMASREGRDFLRVGWIALDIAERPEDLLALSALPESRRSFIVIFGRLPNVVMLGECTPESGRMFDSGGLMFRGAKPFADFREAERLASEANRQGCEPATIARFVLKEARAGRIA